MESKSLSVQYCTTGKFISEKSPMIHQSRIIDSFVLIYGVSGVLHISDGGNEYDVSPNDYIILVADRKHIGTKISPPGISYYWCHFYIQDNFLVFFNGEGKECISFGRERRFVMPLYGHCKDTSKMHLLFHQLIDSSRTPSAYSADICQGFLDIILFEIAGEQLANSDMVTGVSRQATVDNIIEWIRLNASEINSVLDVARYFGYNSEYLTTMVKSVSGKTIVEHINKSRIDQAKEMLRTTEAKLSEIAERCGFDDEKYFSRVFKKYCDISPGKFRNAYLKKHLNDR